MFHSADQEMISRDRAEQELEPNAVHRAGVEGERSGDAEDPEGVQRRSRECRRSARRTGTAPAGRRSARRRCRRSARPAGRPSAGLVSTAAVEEDGGDRQDQEQREVRPLVGVRPCPFRRKIIRRPMPKQQSADLAQRIARVVRSQEFVHFVLASDGQGISRGTLFPRDAQSTLARRQLLLFSSRIRCRRPGRAPGRACRPCVLVEQRVERLGRRRRRCRAKSSRSSPALSALGRRDPGRDDRTGGRRPSRSSVITTPSKPSSSRRQPVDDLGRERRPPSSSRASGTSRSRPSPCRPRRRPRPGTASGRIPGPSFVAAIVTGWSSVLWVASPRPGKCLAVAPTPPSWSPSMKATPNRGDHVRVAAVGPARDRLRRLRAAPRRAAGRGRR